MYVKILVTPSARHESFIKNSDGSFSIKVREEARGNRANRRVLALLAEHLEVSPRVVRIVSGHRSRHKIVSMEEG